MRSMMQNQCQVKLALEPLSPGIGPITCDLQRSVNILILQLDAAADDADAAYAMLWMQYTIRVNRVFTAMEITYTGG